MRLYRVQGVRFSVRLQVRTCSLRMGLRFRVEVWGLMIILRLQG